MRTKFKLLPSALALVFSLCVTAAPDPAGAAAVPESGKSPKIDKIKTRGALKVGAINEFPWLPLNTTGAGPEYSGPAWLLSEEIAKRLGVKLEAVPVSHETKVPILATGEVDITIAPLGVTEARQKVVDFVIYSKYSVCIVGLASNPKLTNVDTVDDLNRSDLTMAYFTGTPPEEWGPKRLPKIKLRGVQGSGANIPIEEIMAKRADVAPIDNVAWPKLNASVAGLVVFPKGDECLRSEEQAAPVGMAIDKGDPVFLAWLRAVADEIKDKLEAEELRIMKSVQ